MKRTGAHTAKLPNSTASNNLWQSLVRTLIIWTGDRGRQMIILSPKPGDRCQATKCKRWSNNTGKAKFKISGWYLYWNTGQLHSDFTSPIEMPLCTRREMTFSKAMAEKAPFSLTAVRRLIAHIREMKKALKNSDANRAMARPAP